MLKKICPWCGEKTTFNQLGYRSAQKNSKWYQFSRNVRVCPYCAGAVKPGGKAIWFLVFVLPSFISIIVDLFTGFDFLARFNFTAISWVLVMIGFGGLYVFGVLEKVETIE